MLFCGHKRIFTNATYVTTILDELTKIFTINGHNSIKATSLFFSYFRVHRFVMFVYTREIVFQYTYRYIFFLVFPKSYLCMYKNVRALREISIQFINFFRVFLSVFFFYNKCNLVACNMFF